MKKILFLLLSVLLFSCSSKDDDPKVTDFTLNVTELEMTVGETFRLEMNVINPTNDYIQQFVSENSEIVYIDVDGLISARKEGNTIVKARYNEIVKTVKVTVKAKEKTLEDYYRDYCFGYKVKDTTDLKIMADTTHINEAVYLTGLRNNKFWFGKFDFTTKEQIEEFLDVQEFELNKKIDLGYGEYENIKIEKFKLDAIYKNESGFVASVKLFSNHQNGYSNNTLDMLIFKESDHNKKYYTKNCKLKKWYKDSYIAYIDIEDVMNKRFVSTSFNGKGEKIASTIRPIFQRDLYPVAYDSCVEILSNYWKDESDNNNFNPSAQLNYYEFSMMYYDIPDFFKNYYYHNATSGRDFKFDYEYLELKNNILTFKVNVTFVKGEKESHTYEFNTKDLTVKEI